MLNSTSVNDITFRVIETECSLFSKSTFVMDRDYDDNKMFLKLDSMEQDWFFHPTFSKNDKLALWSNLPVSKLHFAETQEDVYTYNPRPIEA